MISSLDFCKKNSRWKCRWIYAHSQLRSGLIFVNFSWFTSSPSLAKWALNLFRTLGMFQLKVSDDHFLNVPVGFLSPTLKQQQQQMGSFNSTADQQLGRNNSSLQQQQQVQTTAAGKGEKQQQRKSTGISGLWTTLSGAATGGSRKSSDESQKALEERKLSNSSNPEAEAASYSLPQHQQMTAADSSKSLPRLVYFYSNFFWADTAPWASYVQQREINPLGSKDQKIFA